ncbi:MAG: hypothetical protein ACMVO3_05290 [Thalassobaculum sp.]
MTNVEALEAELLAEVERAGDLDALEQVRISALGKKGRLTAEMKTLGGLDPETRKETGQALNADQGRGMPARIDARKAELAIGGAGRPPGRTSGSTSRCRSARQAEGRIHPISQTIDEIDRDLRRDGLRGRRRPGYRDRLLQFRRR